MMKPPSKRPPSNIKQPTKQQPRRYTSTQKSSNNMSKDTINPSNIPPKYKRPVDVLNYANDIIQKANTSQESNKKILKDQMIDPLDFKAKNLPKNYHYQQSQQKTFQKPFQKQSPHSKIQQGTYQIPKVQNKPQPPKKQKQPQIVQNSNSQLIQMLTQYQNMQKQLLSKVDNLQEQLHQMKQSDKKNANIVKQHKNCTKQIKKLTQCIKQHQIQFNRYVSDSNIPFSNKRQVILQSHIQKLKQYNKQLTVRLKSFKGTQIEQAATTAVKVYVLNDFQKDKQIDYTMQKLQFESLAFKINKQLEGYLTKKLKKNITFVDQQKYITDLINLLNQFGFQCLLQGLRVQTGQIDIEDSNRNLQQRVESQREYPPINDQYNKIIKHSAFNLSVINQTNQLIQDVKPLISKLSKPSSIIFDCFRSTKKLSQIQSKLQQTIGVHVKTLKNTNNVLLSVLTTTLGRYDILKNYVDNLVRDLRRKLKQICIPLDDLHNLFQYKDKKQEIFKEKLCAFVSSNINKLCIKVPELEKQIEEVPIRFSKLVNYL